MNCREAISAIGTFMPPERQWPAYELRLWRQKGTLSHAERFRLAAFLYGNGVEPETMRAALKPRLRDESARRHLRDLCARLEKRPCKWYYFDVTDQDLKYVAGGPAGEASGTRALVRAINAWDEHCWRKGCAGKWPTLEEQREWGL